MKTTRASRCANSPGRWKPQSRSPPGRPAPRPRTRTWPPAWPWPGPAKTPAAPAPGSWPPSPPAAASPAGSATTAPAPSRSRTGSTCPPARSATGPSWTTAPASPASRPTAKAPCSWKAGWYCPALPEPLITATTGLRDHTTDRGTYDSQIAARTPYQLKRKDGPDTDGYQRLSCPALGTHPGLICPLREASLSPRDGRPKVLQPPEEPPKLCRQTAITIAPDAGARYRQDLPCASPAWHQCHAALRNTTEGLNGYAKDPAHQALAQPGRRRVRGIAAQSIFTALLLMAASICKIRAWRAQPPGEKDSTARRARRRRASLPSYLPDG